jgi:hypothetical protein
MGRTCNMCDRNEIAIKNSGRKFEGRATLET